MGGASVVERGHGHASVASPGDALFPFKEVVHQSPYPHHYVPYRDWCRETLASGVHGVEPVSLLLQRLGLNRVQGFTLGVCLCVDHGKSGPSYCEFVFDAVVKVLVSVSIVEAVFPTKTLITAVLEISLTTDEEVKRQG